LLGKWALLVLLISLYFAKGVLPAFTIVKSDFVNYYLSAQMFWDGAEVSSFYDDQAFIKSAKDKGIDTWPKFSQFPPISCILMMPLIYCDVLEAQQYFTLFNLLLIPFCLWLMVLVNGWSWLNNSLLLFASGKALWNNTALGQVYFLLLVLLLLAFYFVKRNRQLGSAFMVSLGAHFKIIPAIIAIAFLQSGKKLWFGFFVLASLVIGVLSIGMIGWEAHQTYLPILFANLGGQLQSTMMFSYTFQSWGEFFHHLFIFDFIYNANPIIDCKPCFTIVKLFIQLALLVPMLWLMFKLKKQTRTYRIAVFTCLWICLMLAIHPATTSYYYLYMTFALTVALPYLKKSVFFVPLLIIYFLIGFIPYQLFWSNSLPTLLHLIMAYPRLWLSNAFFIILLIHFYKQATKPLNDQVAIL